MYFYFIMKKPIDNTKMLKSFVNEIVFKSPNMTQVTIAIKISQLENDISARKRQKQYSKKVLLEKVKMAAKN